MLVYGNGCLVATWWENVGDLELPTFSRCPGQVLQVLEGPTPVDFGNSHTESGPSSPRNTFPAFTAYEDVSQCLSASEKNWGSPLRDPPQDLQEPISVSR